jgi:hypothetical protein
MTSKLVKLLLLICMLGALVYGGLTSVTPFSDGKGCITVNDNCQDRGCAKAVNHSCNQAGDDCLCLEVQ